MFPSDFSHKDSTVSQQYKPVISLSLGHINHYALLGLHVALTTCIRVFEPSEVRSARSFVVPRMNKVAHQPWATINLPNFTFNITQWLPSPLVLSNLRKAFQGGNGQCNTTSDDKNGHQRRKICYNVNVKNLWPDFLLSCQNKQAVYPTTKKIITRADN